MARRYPGPLDEVFARFAALNASLMARTAHIIALAQSAAAVDPELAEHRARARATARADLHALAVELKRRGALAPGSASKTPPTPCTHSPTTSPCTSASPPNATGTSPLRRPHRTHPQSDSRGALRRTRPHSSFRHMGWVCQGRGGGRGRGVAGAEACGVWRVGAARGAGGSATLGQPHIEDEQSSRLAAPLVLLRLAQGDECAGEEEQRVVGRVKYGRSSTRPTTIQ